MSWWRKLKKRVAKAINKAAERISDKIESAGNKISDQAKSLGDAFAQSVPIIGPAIGAVLRWCGRSGSALCDLAGNAVKGLAASLTAVTDLVIGLVGGVVTADWSLIKEAVTGFVANLAGAVLIVVGGIVSLIQTVFGMQARKTKLNEKEIAVLQMVFQGSLDTDNIRLVKGRHTSGVYEFTNRPFTMGEIIYTKDTASDDWFEMLVHECVHVWQYQHEGSRYSADALGAQVILGTTRSYKWWKEVGAWENFNAEAQAKIFEDMYEYGELQDAGAWREGDGRFYRADGTNPNRFLFNIQSQDDIDPRQDFTKLGNDSVSYVRSQPSDR